MRTVHNVEPRDPAWIGSHEAGCGGCCQSLMGAAPIRDGNPTGSRGHGSALSHLPSLVISADRPRRRGVFRHKRACSDVRGYDRGRMGSTPPKTRRKGRRRLVLTTLVVGVPVLAIGLWIAVHKIPWLGPMLAIPSSNPSACASA